MYNLREAYEDALVAYDKYTSHQLECVYHELERNSDHSVAGRKAAAATGKQKWSSSLAAKDVIDEQKFAERKVQLYGTIKTVELLQTISDQLHELQSSLDVWQENWRESGSHGAG